MKSTRFPFYAFPQAMHRHIRSTNAIESFFRNVRRRTDQIDTLYFGNQLSLDCLGCDARHSFVKDCCLVSRFRRKAGVEATSRQRLAWEDFFVCSAGLRPLLGFASMKCQPAVIVSELLCA